MQTPPNICPSAKMSPIYRGRAIDSDGNVYTTLDKKQHDWEYPIRQLAINKNKDGYAYTSILENNHCDTVHRIMWQMHNGEIPEGYEVDHIDFNRSNNKLSNLRLLKIRDNRQRREKICNRARTNPNKQKLERIVFKYENINESSSKIREFCGAFFINFMRDGKYISPRIFGFPVKFATRKDACIILKKMYKLIYLSGVENA